MPIQPLAPTRWLKARLCESPWPGRCGSNVPAAISSARNARTSWRSASHSGGRRIWSNCRLAVIAHATSGQNSSAPRARDVLAELGRPIALVAEIVAPGEHAQREAMQDVLLGEADRAEHLMRDGGAFGRGFGAADFRGGRFEENGVVEFAARARSCRRPSRRPRARRRLRRRAAQDSAARPGISRSAARRRRARWHSATLSVEDRLQRAGGLHAAHGRSPSASARSWSKPAGAARPRAA